MTVADLGPGFAPNPSLPDGRHPHGHCYLAPDVGARSADRGSVPQGLSVPTIHMA